MMWVFCKLCLLFVCLFKRMVLFSKHIFGLIVHLLSATNSFILIKNINLKLADESCLLCHFVFCFSFAANTANNDLFLLKLQKTNFLWIQYYYITLNRNNYLTLNINKRTQHFYNIAKQTSKHRFEHAWNNKKNYNIIISETWSFKSKSLLTEWKPIKIKQN